MLVLTRKLGESVQLRLADGRTVIVRVVVARGGLVRLGFEAPADVTIVRSELAAEWRGEAGNNGQGTKPPGDPHVQSARSNGRHRAGRKHREGTR